MRSFFAQTKNVQFFIIFAVRTKVDPVLFFSRFVDVIITTKTAVRDNHNFHVLFRILPETKEWGILRNGSGISFEIKKNVLCL